LLNAKELLCLARLNVGVRVQPAGSFAVGAPDLFRSGIHRKAQTGVEISFLGHENPIVGFMDDLIYSSNKP
jgi:hypothetical protein